VIFMSPTLPPVSKMLPAGEIGDRCYDIVLGAIWIVLGLKIGEFLKNVVNLFADQKLNFECFDSNRFYTITLTPVNLNLNLNCSIFRTIFFA
jgi:hypothetical protein